MLRVKRGLEVEGEENDEWFRTEGKKGLWCQLWLDPQKRGLSQVGLLGGGMKNRSER